MANQQIKEAYQALLDHDTALAYDMIPGASVVHKFGYNASVGTSFVPITSNAAYKTPQVAGAVALRVKAGGNAADTAAGAGAREVTFQGLDETGALVSEAVATAGASESSATTTTFIRLFRAWVSASGGYATTAAGSHTAAITIEDSGGVADWATIPLVGIASAQTEICAYTVPLGYTALLRRVEGTTEANKLCSVMLFQRQNILETAAPYTAMREVFRRTGIDGQFFLNFSCPISFPALTDLILFGKVSTSTAEIQCDLEITLIKND